MVAIDQKILDDYARDGYARIPGVFTRSECDKMRAAAMMCLSKIPANDPGCLQTVTNNDQVYPALLFWPGSIDRYLKSVSVDHRLHFIVRAFLGNGAIRQLNNQLYYRFAGDGDQFAWHQDICFRTPKEKFSQIENGYLQTVILVDDVHEDGGAVEFIHGSHKQGDLNLIPRNNTEQGLRKFIRGDRRGTKAVGFAGDVMVWSVMTVHGSEPNNRSGSRITYMNGFAKDECILDKSQFPLYCGAI